MKIKNTGERLIAQKHSEHSPMFLRHKAAYIFAERFIKDKITLDNGCGSGYGSYHLITNGAKKVIGIDISKDAVEYARKSFSIESLEFKVNNATKLEFDENTFEALTSFQVIEHIGDVHSYLSEIERVLKKDAVAIISTPNKKTYSPNSSKPENPFHVKEYFLDELRELLKDFFDNVEIYGVNSSQRMENLEKSHLYKFKNFLKKLLKKTHLLFLLNLIPGKIQYILSKQLNKNIDISDFCVTKDNLENCLDFIAVCKKNA